MMLAWLCQIAFQPSCGVGIAEGCLLPSLRGPPISEPPIASAVTRESAACVKNSQLSAHSYPAPRVGAGRRAALFGCQCRISSRSSRQQKLVRVGGFGGRNTICKLHPGSSRLGGRKRHAHSSGILQSRALRMVAMVWGHQQRYAGVKQHAQQATSACLDKLRLRYSLYRLRSDSVGTSACTELLVRGEAQQRELHPSCPRLQQRSTPPRIAYDEPFGRRHGGGARGGRFRHGRPQPMSQAGHPRPAMGHQVRRDAGMSFGWGAGTHLGSHAVCSPSLCNSERRHLPRPLPSVGASLPCAARTRCASTSRNSAHWRVQR